MSALAIVTLCLIDDQIIITSDQRIKTVVSEYGGKFVKGLEFSQTDAVISDALLGEAILDALDKSSNSDPVDLDLPKREKREMQWRNSVVRMTKYNTWTEFRNAVQKVNIYRYEDGDVEVVPTAHQSRTFVNWVAKLETLPMPTGEEIGSATKRAFALSK